MGLVFLSMEVINWQKREKTEKKSLLSYFQIEKENLSEVMQTEKPKAFVKKKVIQKK